MNWIGIDYGSKLAGTTVICELIKKKLVCHQSIKGKSADLFIENFIEGRDGIQVFLDAPLSLPGAYFGKGEDFFYRTCDRETQAMSPMFLGGLTARAMRIKSKLTECTVLECYPGYLARKILDIQDVYQKKKALTQDAIIALNQKLPSSVHVAPENWHQYDAALCWLSGYRYSKGKALRIGKIDEGQIII